MSIAGWRLRLAACLTGLLALAGSAQAERRVALVIGNEAYQHLEVLHKAVADAETYAEVLKAKGF